MHSTINVNMIIIRGNSNQQRSPPNINKLSYIFNILCISRPQELLLGPPEMEISICCKQLVKELNQRLKKLFLTTYFSKCYWYWRAGYHRCRMPTYTYNHCCIIYIQYTVMNTNRPSRWSYVRIWSVVLELIIGISQNFDCWRIFISSLITTS